MLLGAATLALAAAAVAAAPVLAPALAQGPRRGDELKAEHEARKARLAEIAKDARVGTPELYDALVPRGEMPAAIGSDVPVLRVVFPQKVFFDTDRDDLLAGAEAVVDLVAGMLKGEGGEVSVFVAGHTDSRAGDAYNLDLSIRRAEAVARDLDARGVGKAKLWRIGFGRAVPLVPNTSEANMARNRRVEFLVSGRAEAIRAWLVKQDALICAGADPATRIACRQALAAAPSFEARSVGAGADGRAMPVVVKVVGIRPARPKPPAAVRLEGSGAPVAVEMALPPQVYVRRPDL